MLKTPEILWNDLIHFGEVKFYFTKIFEGETQAFALVSLYSPPNKYILRYSHGTLIVCRYQGEAMQVVVDVESIVSVVAMVPFQYQIDGLDNYYFMIEKIGLDTIEVDTNEEDEQT